jgi:hypothetical protein
MPQPPTTPIIPREMVRVIPFAAQRTFQNAALGVGATIVVEFDVAKRISDRNQLNLGAGPPPAVQGAFPGVANPPVAVGPNLDALWFSDHAGSVTIDYAVDQGTLYRSMFVAIVGANVPGNISGLRITGRFVRATYTNTDAAPALVELGIYVRSS